MRADEIKATENFLGVGGNLSLLRPCPRRAGEPGGWVLIYPSGSPARGGRGNLEGEVKITLHTSHTQTGRGVGGESHPTPQAPLPALWGDSPSRLPCPRRAEAHRGRLKSKPRGLGLTIGHRWLIHALGPPARGAFSIQQKRGGA